MSRRILSIIPARGGSKGLPKKNIANLNGKPLIAWTIEASLRSQYITKTLVSSDDDKILKISEGYGASILKRPDEYSSDDSTSEVVILHVLRTLENTGKKYDFVVLLQPTSPLRTAIDIDGAFAELYAQDATSLISVYEPAHSPLKSFVVSSEGYLKGIVNDEYPFMSRHDLPRIFQSNGAIYIINVKCFLDKPRLFTNKAIYYEMPINKSIDIDNFDDLHQAEKLLST